MIRAKPGAGRELGTREQCGTCRDKGPAAGIAHLCKMLVQPRASILRSYLAEAALSPRSTFLATHNAFDAAAPPIVLSNMHHTVSPARACILSLNASPSRYEVVYDEK